MKISLGSSGRIYLFSIFTFIYQEYSKRRHILRKKISAEKEKFENLAKSYNQLVDEMERNGSVRIKRIDSAKKYEIFPWRDSAADDGGTHIILTCICLFKSSA